MRTFILVSFHNQSFQFYVKSVLYFVVVLLLMKVGNSELQAHATSEEDSGENSGGGIRRVRRISSPGRRIKGRAGRTGTGRQGGDPPGTREEEKLEAGAGCLLVGQLLHPL